MSEGNTAKGSGAVEAGASSAAVRIRGSPVMDPRDALPRRHSLNELQEGQKAYALKVSEFVRGLQEEADTIVQIPSEILGDTYTAGYLVSDAVVVMFDKARSMVSKPLRNLPPAKIIAIVGACTPVLKSIIAEKRTSEKSDLRSLERMMQELEAEGEVAHADSPVATVAPRAQAAPVQDTSNADAVILAAVDQGLSFLGEDGKKVLLSLLEKRYGLRATDIPDHPRGFVDILGEVVGGASKAVEDEIVNQLKQSSGARGSTFTEVVRELKGPERGGGNGGQLAATSEGSDFGGAAQAGSAGPRLEHEQAPALELKQEAAAPVAESRANSGAEAAGAAGPAVADNYKLNFKIESKPISISQFLTA